MADLRQRSGMLVAAHRARVGWKQTELADRVGLSDEMISRIETGNTGVSFRTIERLAEAFGVDAAELFSAQFPNGALSRPALVDLAAKLARMDDRQLEWIAEMVAVAAKR